MEKLNSKVGFRVNIKIEGSKENDPQAQTSLDDIMVFNKI